MARVNVFLKDDLLKAIDAEAADSRTKRSALIQKALLEYLEARRREREESTTSGRRTVTPSASKSS